MGLYVDRVRLSLFNRNMGRTSHCPYLYPVSYGLDKWCKGTLGRNPAPLHVRIAVFSSINVLCLPQIFGLDSTCLMCPVTLQCLRALLVLYTFCVSTTVWHVEGYPNEDEDLLERSCILFSFCQFTQCQSHLVRCQIMAQYFKGHI